MPADRTQANREHRVPLCDRALEIVDETRRLDDGDSTVFAKGNGRELAERQVRQMLERLGIADTEIPVGPATRLKGS